MTKEDRELFLSDLFPRFVYGVKVQSWTGEIRTTCLNAFPFSREEMDEEDMWDWLDSVKPYLRPISNMTKEEEAELLNICGGDFLYKGEISIPIAHPTCESVELLINTIVMATNWLYSHHFDVNGLIEKGLALPAPDEMYKIKNYE